MVALMGAGYADEEQPQDPSWPYEDTPINTTDGTGSPNGAENHLPPGEADGDTERLDDDAELYEEIADSLEDAIEDGTLIPDPELLEELENWREAHPEEEGDC